MENRHVTQALQEMLSDLPPEDQALKILFFTERLEALEAAEFSRIGTNVQQGWGNIDGYGEDEAFGSQESRYQETGKDYQASKGKGRSLAWFLVLASLAIIVFVILAVLFVSRGGKPVEPVENGKGTVVSSAPENTPSPADTSVTAGGLDMDANQKPNSDQSQARKRLQSRCDSWRIASSHSTILSNTLY